MCEHCQGIDSAASGGSLVLDRAERLCACTSVGVRCGRPRDSRKYMPSA
jgi:hypothetical protein